MEDNIKCTSICIIEITERKEKEKGPQKIFEELKTFLTWERKQWMKEVQEAQSPRKDKPKEEHTQ